MNLKCYTQMCAKIKESSLVFDVQIENYSQTSAAQRYHGGSFIVGLGNIALKIVLVVYYFDVTFFD